MRDALAFPLWTTALGLIAFGAFALVDALVPPQHLFWAPLEIAHPIGMTTQAKTRALAGDGEACFATLDRGEIEYSRVPQSEPGENCGFYDALALQRSAVPYSAPVRLTCPLTAALAIWERHVALPAAEEILGSPLARIETFGSYSCRRLYGRASGRFSEHATANAIDISGFVLADGRRISVRSGWDGEGEAAAFLREVHDGACGAFTTVLGPDYNDAHADHFHFDMGRWSVCR